MPDVVDKLLELSPEELKRWSQKKRKLKRRERRTHGRPERTKEQLSEYLKKSNFRTRDQLRAGRQEGDPMDSDYGKAYGTWTKAVEEIFGVKLFDRRYVIKSIIEFNLWKREDYRKARSKRPDVFLSEKVIINNFGSWKALRKMASAVSLRKTIEQYIALKERIGKRPTQQMCHDEGVILESAIKVYGSKKEFDKFIESLEEMI